jgi:hypothetical protein
MQYDLRAPKLQYTFQIKCNLADKPQILSELIDGIQTGTIKWQYSSEEEGERWLDTAKVWVIDGNDEELETDFTTQKPIRFNINWIPTERL